LFTKACKIYLQILINTINDSHSGDEYPGGTRNREVCECTLTSDPGYIIYSACGSFWVPMLVMDVFYWKIYKTAVSATDAFRRGFIECPAAPGGSESTPQSIRGRFPFAAVPNSKSENSIALRVHRGSRTAAPGEKRGVYYNVLTHYNRI